jgi:hypothetical protein
VEALALAAAVGVASVLALPTLGRIQVKSELASCLANQRQLIQAYLLYTAENQDRLLAGTWTPTNQLVDLNSGGYWPGPTRPIATGLPPEAALAAVKEGLARGPLWPYAPDPALHHCPGDRRWTTLAPGNGWGWDSYSKADGMGSGLAAGVRPFKRGAEVRDPAASALFIEESDPRGSNLGAWSLGVATPSWTDVPAATHEDGGMFGFYDGHAELRRWTEPTTLLASRQSMLGRPSFFFEGAGPQNPDFIWVWNRYRHLGWKALP